MANVLLDDQQCGIRHLVADKGDFFYGQRVLISTISLGQVGWWTRRLHAAPTSDERPEHRR